MYYWNSLNETGNALTYVTKHLGIDFKEAVIELCEFSGGDFEEPETERILEVELKNDLRRSFAYLTKTRGIKRDLVRFLVKEKLVSETKENNLAFLIKDENSNVVGMELNTTLSNSRFKGFARNSKYGYGFNIKGTNNPKSAFYFESAIDMASFIQQLGGKKFSELLTNSVFISMGGLKESVIRNMQNIYNAEIIYICVDNPSYEKILKDGSKPAQNFIDKIKKEFSFKTIQPRNCKDWNELLNRGNKNFKSEIEISDVVFEEIKENNIDDVYNTKNDEFYMKKNIDKEITKLFNSGLLEQKKELLRENSDTLIVSNNILSLMSVVTIMKSKGRSVDRSEDNMLKITMEGRAVAIDPRILEENEIVDYDSKINVCVDNIFEFYKKYDKDKGIQAVFLDFGVKLHKVIKNALMEKGIKESEIGLIKDVKNKIQREELFENCRKGSVRVIIGTSKTMGTGVNIQDRMIALHHIDCPWKPCDLEQRDGRIRRQGNMYDKVNILRYVTEGCFDSYLWQLQEKKQLFISQIMNNNLTYRSYEDDIDERALEYSEVKALCCGDLSIEYLKENVFNV
jgi:hypothetical protein